MSPGSTDRLFCTFWIGDHYLGLDVAVVREILTGVGHTSVPRSGETIAGLLNLRGEIVTVIDLRRRLRLDDADGITPDVHIVVELGEQVIAVLVDRVDDVLDLTAMTSGSVPPTVAPDVRELMVGVYSLPTSLLQVLDAEKIAGLPAPAQVSS